MRRQHLFAVTAVGLVLLASVGCGASGPTPRAAGGDASGRARVPAGSGQPLAPAAGSSAVAGTRGFPAADGVPTAGSAAGSPGVGVSASAGPVAEVHTAVAKIAGQNLVFTLGDGIARANGRFDAATGAAVLARVEDGRPREMSVLGNDLFLVGFAPDGRVLKARVDGLPPGSELLAAALPLASLTLLTGVTRAESSVNTYTGKLDLARVDPGPSVALRRFVEYLTKQAGDRAGELPFTATVDGFGRLAGFRATFPRADAGHDLEYEFAVREIGTAVSVSRPPGQATDVPDAFYLG